jgi:hypothetical protein
MKQIWVQKKSVIQKFNDSKIQGLPARLTAPAENP